MEGFEYEMIMKDGMSSPARQEIDALKALQGQIGATEKSLHALQGEQLNYKRAGFKDAASSVGQDIARMRQHLGGLKIDLRSAAAASKEHAAAEEHAFAHLAGGVAVGELLADAIKDVAGEMKDAAVESFKFAVEASEFRENTILAYSAVKGTAEEGEEAFMQLDRVAQRVHMPARQAHALAQDLMLKGLEDTKLISSTIEASSALMRTGQIAGAAKLEKIIDKSLASGRFDPGKLGGGKKGPESGRALAGLGISLPQLYQSLADQTGLGIDKVKAQLKAGKVSTEDGVAAIVNAINGGVIGKTARAKYDIHDLTADIGNSFTRMVQEIDLKTLESSLYGVNITLDNMAQHKDGIQGVFQTLVDWAGKGVEAVTLFGLKIENAFLRAELAIQPVVHAVERAQKAIADAALWLEKHAPGGGRLAQVDSEKLPAMSPQDQAEFDAWKAQMTGDPQAGAKTVNAHNFDVLGTQAGAALGDAAVQGARDATHTHSPSDDFKDVGKDWADGLGIGFSANSIVQSLKGMTPSGGGGRSVTIEVGGVHVSVPPGADHGAIGHVVESALEDVLERFALELGA